MSKNELFTAHGVIGMVDGKKKFIPKSPAYVRDQMSKLQVGKNASMTLSETKAIRSPAQLAYHWVLMGYIAEYTGNTKEEMHDAIMRIKFGEKEVRIGNYKVRVRKSVSDEARMAKFDMVDLISFDLELCADLEIRVPTAEELGYIPNTKPKVS